MTDAFYRYEVTRYAAPLDEFDNPVGGGTLRLRLDTYQVVRKTPKGVWITDGLSKDKFILLSAKKRWACPTKEEAAVAFAARKRRHISILKGQMETAEQALELISKEG